MKNIKSISLIITTFILLVGFASCSILPTEEPYVQPPVLESVKVEYVMDTIIREDMVIEVKANAHLMSTTQSDVYFEEYGGYIGTIEVKSSQEVKAGDVLITMNTRSLEKQKSLAYYNYARAKLTHSHLVETEADEYQIKMASYSKSSAWLTYDDLKYQLEASVLVAPIDGIVTFLTDSVAGDYVQAKQILITIADPTDLIVIIPSESSMISSFPLGDEVKVVVKGNTYEGLVIGSAMGLSAEIALVDRVTKITVDETIEGGRIGDTVRVKKVIDFRENVLVINKSVVSVFNGKYIVYVMIDGVKVDKFIDVGLESNTRYEILDGLKEGDQIVVN